MKLVITMPAFNEADGIGEFITLMCDGFEEMRRERTDWPFTSYEIIVVDDCSTDNTIDVLEAIRIRSGVELKIIHKERNSGHGPTTILAYKEALRSSPGVVTFVDGDGQFEVEDILSTARICGIRNEIVIASRQNRTDPIYRSFITKSLRLLVLCSSRRFVPDVNSPLRNYPSSDLIQLINFIPDSSRIPNVYLTLLQIRFKHEVKYIPVKHRLRRGSSKTGTTWRSARRYVKVPFKLLVFTSRAFLEYLRFVISLRRQDKAPSNAD